MNFLVYHVTYRLKMHAFRVFYKKTEHARVFTLSRVKPHARIDHYCLIFNVLFENFNLKITNHEKKPLNFTIHILLDESPCKMRVSFSFYARYINHLQISLSFRNLQLRLVYSWVFEKVACEFNKGNNRLLVFYKLFIFSPQSFSVFLVPQLQQFRLKFYYKPSMLLISYLLTHRLYHVPVVFFP